MTKRRIFILKTVVNAFFISFISLMSLCACSNPSFEDDLKSKLEALSSVVEVNKFEMKNKDYKCGYEVFH